MRKTILFVAILFAVASFPTVAQHDHADQKVEQNAQTEGVNAHDMMGGEMMAMMHEKHMSGMVDRENNPIQYSLMIVSVLPNMTEKFDYSESQTISFDELSDEYTAIQNPRLTERSQNEAEVGSLLALESPDMDGVRSLISEIAVLDGDINQLAIETMLSMRALLSAKQRGIADEMAPMDWHQYMMASMNMMDTMPAMHGVDMKMEKAGGAGMMTRIEIKH